MTFTSWFNGALKTVGGAIEHAATGVAHFASSSLDKVIGGAVKLAHEGRLGMTGAAHEMAAAAGSVAHEAGGAASSLGSSFAWPLALAGGAVGIAFLMKR